MRAFVVAVLGLAPACGGDDPLRDFAITEPGLLGDAARTSTGTSLAVAWAIEPGRIGLYRLHADVLDGDAPIGRVFAWDAQLPAGSYTLRARIEREGATFVDGATQVTWRPAD